MNTISHELRHAKQEETSIFKTLLEILFPNKYSPSKLKLDKHFAKAKILYPSLINFPVFRNLVSVKKAYLKNGLEVDAKKIGLKDRA